MANSVDPDQMPCSDLIYVELRYRKKSEYWDTLTSYHKIQNTVDGSNIFVTMEIRSRHG